MGAHGLAAHVAAPRRASASSSRATRALFDERGMQDAPIEEIARAVGIARGLIYRQFSSKEELYVLTVTDYLAELDGLLGEAIVARPRAASRSSRRWARAYVGFCLRYPAFLDCALSLMHRPAGELREALSESVWLRLGQGIASCVVHVVRDPARRRRATARSPSRTPTTWPTCCGRRSSAPRTWRASASACGRSRPGIPELFTRRARAARATRAWPARWRPSAPSRQARARGAAAAFGRRHALRGAPAGGRVAARADGGRRRRALRGQVPRRGAGAGRARGRGRGRRAGAAAGAAGPRARHPRAAAPSWRGPSPTPRSRTCSTPARASTSASTSCPARCPSRRPPWPRSIPSWRPTSCGSTR